MKYIIAFLLALVAFGCATSVVQQEESIYSFGLDFTEFTAKGFLFTPESYLGDYESIGLLTTQLEPELLTSVPTKGIQKFNVKEYRILTRGQNIYYLRYMNKLKAIRDMYERAVEMGANAIVDLDIRYYDIHNGDIIYSGIELSGFAIKRNGPNQIQRN